MLDTEELLEVIEFLAIAIGRARGELAQLDDGIEEWPLPDDVVKERWQRAAFVAVVEEMVEEQRNSFRERFKAKLADIESSRFATCEMQVPIDRDVTRELEAVEELVGRAAVFDPRLREAARAFLMSEW